MSQSLFHIVLPFSFDFQKYLLSIWWTLVLFSLTELTFRLCLVGVADTPGCVSLLPASLFSNSNPG